MTDTDILEELAKWFRNQANCESNNEQYRQNCERADFLRSLSATIKDLREKEEALEWLEKYTNFQVEILATQISESGNPPKILPYLKKRLGKEG